MPRLERANLTALEETALHITSLFFSPFQHAELSLTVDLTNTVFCAIPMKSGALLATTDGTLRSCKWKGIFLGNENVQNSISFTRDSRTVVTSMDGVDGTSTVALATDSGRVVVVKLTSKSC